MDPLQATLVAVVFAIAGVVKGISGMGLPTVAMSLLGLFLSPAQAATLLVVPSLATNVAQCPGASCVHLPRGFGRCGLAWFWRPSLAPGPDVGASAANAQKFLGVVLLLYGLWGLWRPVLPMISTQRAWPAILAGTLTGFLTAATAVFVIPMVPYLQTLRLEKDAMIQALGLSFTVATAALAIRLHDARTFELQPALTGLALLMALAGIWAGSRYRSKLSQQTFQRVLFSVFVTLGGVNLWRSL